MDTGQSLCKSCGICCDGTLFRYAPLEEHEDKKNYLFLNIIEEEGNSKILLPCVVFDAEEGCEVYDIRPNIRPNICGAFRCRLLRQLDAGKITLEQAQKKVAVAKEERSKVVSAIQDRALFFELKPLAEKFRLLFHNNDLGPIEVDYKGEFATTLLAYGSLNWLLDTHFRLKENENSK